MKVREREDVTNARLERNAKIVIGSIMGAMFIIALLSIFMTKAEASVSSTYDFPAEPEFIVSHTFVDYPPTYPNGKPEVWCEGYANETVVPAGTVMKISCITKIDTTGTVCINPAYPDEPDWGSDISVKVQF